MVQVNYPGTVLVQTDKGHRKTVMASARKEFALRINKRREQKGWSQSELARNAGVSRDAISAYCLGKALPTESNAKRLADALDCLPGDLIPMQRLSELEPSRTGSPLYLDPVVRPLEGKIRINEWLPLDIARQIIDLYMQAMAQRSPTPTATAGRRVRRPSQES